MSNFFFFFISSNNLLSTNFEALKEGLPVPLSGPLSRKRQKVVYHEQFAMQIYVRNQ